MKLTTKGRYAVTAMLDLALHEQDGPVPLADIAQRQCLSQSYLEQLFSRLRRTELVKSIHGPGGGYRLLRKAEEISVAEVIMAVNEAMDTTGCGGHRNCQDGRVCLSHEIWEGLSDHIYDYLSKMTLAEAIDRYESRDGSVIRPVVFEGLN